MSRTYADSFGYQWNLFSREQLDSHTGRPVSENRFRAITGWTPEYLRGKLVLDAGCGAGRFAEVAAGFGARVVAVDLSQAIQACQRNVPTARVCQASILDLPFPEGSFDAVYSIGVLQHTPDPLRALACAARMVRPGGDLAVWIYERNWKSFLGTSGFRALLRPWISSLPTSTQLRVCQALVRACLPVVRWASGKGALGRIALRSLPVAGAHFHDLGLSQRDFERWVLLDTFDMLTPAYDSPQAYHRVAAVLRSEGFVDLTRRPVGAIGLTARRR